MITPRLALAPSTPNPPSRPAAPDLDAELRQVQDQITRTEAALQEAEGRHSRQLRSSADLATRCNGLANQLQPMYQKEARLIYAKRIACYAGLAGSGFLGLGPGLMNISIKAGLAVFLVDVLTLGAAFLVVEKTKKDLNTLRPRANALTNQWKGLKSAYDANARDALSSRSDIHRLQTQLNGFLSQRQVIQMAQGVNQPPPPRQAVHAEDDAIVIGQLRIPRRSQVCEKNKDRRAGLFE